MSAGRRDFGRGDDMFDLIEKLSSNRLEDQRVDMPPEMGIDSHSMNFDVGECFSYWRLLFLLPLLKLPTQSDCHLAKINNKFNEKKQSVLHALFSMLMKPILAFLKIPFKLIRFTFHKFWGFFCFIWHNLIRLLFYYPVRY